MVETEGTAAGGMTEGEFRKDVESKTPVGRIGQPQDIASVVTFLASDDASWVSGETWFVSGGFR
jgi:3-oxoacyl-[acyl-carrier protein] reductase